MKNWTIMKKEATGKHECFYGPLDVFAPEEVEGYIEIPYEEWNASDFAEVLGNILEDRNHHWMTDIPHMLLEVLVDADFDDRKKTFVMKRFTERMVQEKFQ